MANVANARCQHAVVVRCHGTRASLCPWAVNAELPALQDRGATINTNSSRLRLRVTPKGKLKAARVDRWSIAGKPQGSRQIMTISGKAVRSAGSKSNGFETLRMYNSIRTFDPATGRKGAVRRQKRVVTRHKWSNGTESIDLPGSRNRPGGLLRQKDGQYSFQQRSSKGLFSRAIKLNPADAYRLATERGANRSFKLVPKPQDPLRAAARGLE